MINYKIIACECFNSDGTATYMEREGQFNTLTESVGN